MNTPASHDEAGTTPDTIQSTQRRPIFRWLATGAVAALALALGSNHYLARHHEVFVVNGYNQPITVSVGEFGSVQVASNGLTALVLPEGRHQAKVRGAVERMVDFEFSSGFWDRWSDKVTRILNPGGAALIVWEQSVSGTMSAADAAASVRLHFGTEFFTLTNVDYVFANFPPSLTTPSAGARKSRVALLKADPSSLISSSLKAGDLPSTLRLAEWDLQAHPAGNPVLNLYVGVAKQARQVAPARAFLRQGLSRRPVDMAWHRAYQEMFAEEDDPRQIMAEYDALLRAEPTNSALLYLRGRLSSDDQEGPGYFERAVACDGLNPYALNAVGFGAAARGDWATARNYFVQAHQRLPDEIQFSESLFEARLALGEFAALEQELRADRAKFPLDMDVHRKLCDVLAAQRKWDEGRQVLAEFERGMRQRYQQRGEDLILTLRRGWFYAAEDFAALEKSARDDKSEGGREAWFEALVESSRLAEAAQAIPLNDPVSDGPWLCLVLSVAWHGAGNATQAAAWRERATEMLAHGRKEWRRAAVLLKRSEPTLLPELLQARLGAKYKAVLLVALAQRFPAQRAELLPLANSLNADRTFPYHLIRRLCVAGPPP